MSKMWSLRLAVIGLVLHVTAQTSSPAKPKATAISHYMQQMGLLYLETAEDMLEDVRSSDSKTSVSLEDDPYRKALGRLEDRIRITITSDADKRYLELLKRFSYVAELDVLKSGEQERTSSQWHLLAEMCKFHARATAMSGKLDAGDSLGVVDAGCTEHDLMVLVHKDEARQKEDEKIRGAESSRIKAEEEKRSACPAGMKKVLTSYGSYCQSPK